MPLTRTQRDQWAKELESGRWKQCRQMMAEYRIVGDDEFEKQAHCCLDVLSEAVLDGADPFEPWLTDAQIRHFVNLNDLDGLTFPEIAKHVRALPVSEEEV